MRVTSAINFEEFKVMCLSVMTVSSEQKEINEQLIRDFAEKTFTIDQIKSLFAENLNEQQMLIYIEIIVKYVVTNGNCKMAQRNNVMPSHTDGKRNKITSN